MDPLILSILITVALRHAWENGKAEYAHVRGQRAAELARTYPDWSPGRVNRVARRAARRYWWQQIRGGFPEVRAAYTESKELAEATRLEGEAAGLQRRADIRERIRKALADAEKVRELEREREAEAPGAAKVLDPDASKGDKPAPSAKGDAGKTPPKDGTGARPAPRPADPAPEPKTEIPAPAAPPAPPQPCAKCGTDPAWHRPGAGRLCDSCWTAHQKDKPAPDPNPGAPEPAEPRSATVIPLKPPQATASAPTKGENMTVPTGEYTGFEAAVANWTAIEQLSQQLNTHYEQLMAAYRAMQVDDQTIGRAAACHEAEENHLVAVQAARGDFVSRHGAVKETKEATGTSGDQALYNS